MEGLEVQKQAFDQMMQIYDFAEQAIDLCEKFPEDTEPFLPLIENIVAKVEKNCDIMTTNFEKYLKSGRVLSGVEKMKIYKAKKEIDEAFENFFQKVGIGN
ncbi:MAG: hypothetical protein SFT90_08005 [Rickettsiales bacterium]|nr:hypothetical protein [Rickettsiales bacterium]